MPERNGLTLRDLPFLAGRSLSLDVRTLHHSQWPVRSRVGFISSKARALTRLLRGAPAEVTVNGARFVVSEIADIGTLQSAITDTDETLAGLGHSLPDAPVVIDVGAHRGEFLVGIKQIRPRASVLSFEPDPLVFTDLEHNAGQWPETEARCLAIGSRAGRLPLYRAPLSAMSSLDPNTEQASVDSVDVDVLSLDEACSAVGEIDLLKIDVEGHEADVIAGAPAVLGRSRFVLIEIGMARAGASNLEVLSMIHALRPAARIIAVGRPLGNAHQTLCQDILIDLSPGVHG